MCRRIRVSFSMPSSSTACATPCTAAWCIRLVILLLPATYGERHRELFSSCEEGASNMTAHNQPCAVLPDRRAKPYAMEPKGMADTICELDPLEPIFRAIVYAILREPGVLTRGSILDAGANDGQDSCMYASLQSDRVVHAVEPSLLNVQHIQKKYAALTNLRILHGGLGNTDRDMSMRGPNTPAPVGVSLQDIDMRLSTARRDADIKAGSFHVYKLDDLLLNETGAWKHEHLAFAVISTWRVASSSFSRAERMRFYEIGRSSPSRFIHTDDRVTHVRSCNTLTTPSATRRCLWRRFAGYHWIAVTSSLFRASVRHRFARPHRSCWLRAVITYSLLALTT